MASLVNEIVQTEQNITLLYLIKKSICRYYAQSLFWEQALLDSGKYVIKFITPFHSQYKHFPCISLSWLIEITKQEAIILVTYVLYNGSVNFISIEDERMNEQIKHILKGVNLHKFKFSYIFTSQKMIMIKSVIHQFTFQPRIQLYLNGLLLSIQKQISDRFLFFLPFLATSSQFLAHYAGLNGYLYQFNKRLHQKDFYQRLSDLKNKFISAKNKRKQTITICSAQKQSKKGQDSSQTIEILKKIQPVMKMIFFNMFDYFHILSSLKEFSTTSKLQISLDERKEVTEQICDQTVVSGIKIVNEKSKEQNNLKQVNLKISNGSNGSISFQKLQFWIQQSIFIHPVNLEVKQRKLSKMYNGNSSSSSLDKLQVKTRQTTQQERIDDFFEDFQNNRKIFQKQLAKKVPMSSSQAAINSFKNQITVLTYLRNQKCKYLGKYYLQSDQQKRYSILYMSIYQLNLKEFLDKKLKLTLNTLLKLALKIAKGISFLQYKSVCHRDIKPANIMIDESEQTQQLTPKLIDFGSCCPAIDKNQPFSVPQVRLLSTKGYFKPYEQVSSQTQKLYSVFQYEQHSNFDSYSLGKIIQKIFNLKNGFKMENIKQRIIKENLDFIVESCLQQNPINRLSPNQVCDFLEFLIIIDEKGWSKSESKASQYPQIVNQI